MFKKEDLICDRCDEEAAELFGLHERFWVCQSCFSNIFPECKDEQGQIKLSKLSSKDQLDFNYIHQKILR